MATTILSNPGDYPAIRSRLGVTSDDLPDADIDSLGLLQVGEEMIKSAVVDYATILAGGGANKIYLQSAAIALCGALACAKFQIQFRHTRTEDMEDETLVDWSARRDELVLEARRYLLLITTHSHRRRTLFVAAGPTSSGCNWPDRIERWYARVQPQVVTWLADNGRLRYGWENHP